MKQGPITARVSLRELMAVSMIPRINPEIRTIARNVLHLTTEVSCGEFSSTTPSPFWNFGDLLLASNLLNGALIFSETDVLPLVKVLGTSFGALVSSGAGGTCDWVTGTIGGGMYPRG